MDKPIIGIDIDDVLANSAKGFVEWSNKRFGTSLAPSDYDEHFAKLWQIDNEETHIRTEELHKTGVLLGYESIDLAYGVLKKLSQKYKLVIVTSRRTQGRQDTLAWINKFYPGIFDANDINFAGIWDKIEDSSLHRTKSDLCKKLGVDYLIDDQLKHCLSAADFNIKALLFGNYSWNQCDNLPVAVTRVANWAEVEKYFAKI